MVSLLSQIEIGLILRGFGQKINTKYVNIFVVSESSDNFKVGAIYFVANRRLT